MSDAVYATLARQTGLMKEMQVVANNIANSNTTGFKTDRAVFAEFLVDAGAGAPSISMGSLAGHAFELAQGELKFTGATFDLAIQGEGFFVLETGQGQRLTRAGHFQLSPEGALVDPTGARVLGAGGNEIAIPEGATNISISADGAISADGELVDRVGVMQPDGVLERDSDTRFIAPGGLVEVEGASIVQGALEQSNVSPVLEVSRMIEVQRAYEAGQALLERDDQRINKLISAVRER